MKIVESGAISAVAAATSRYPRSTINGNIPAIRIDNEISLSKGSR
jgi:hypothetical protein